MARKRLYGETQKRRKKKQTQALKRQSSVTRVQSTFLPAAFQRSGEVSPQDVVFMEAMLDMGVKRYPRSGEAPVRQEKFETQHFAATRENQDSFLATMENLDVRPMTNKRGGRPSRPAAPPPAEEYSAQKDPALPAVEYSSQADPAPQGGALTPPEGESAPPEGDSAPQDSAIAPHERAIAPEEKAAAQPPGPNTEPKTGSNPESAKPAEKERPQRTTAATTFALSGQDAEMMAEALREGEFDPRAKFEGAPAPKPPPPARPQREDSEREPDAELDLHGKTQEEAIQLVQNFLLTSYHRKLRHVLIITGKGHNSGAAGPVLREAVYHWLERNGERFARSFAWAPARHGGEGAIWVVLR